MVYPPTINQSQLTKLILPFPVVSLSIFAITIARKPANSVVLKLDPSVIQASSSVYSETK